MARLAILLLVIAMPGPAAGGVWERPDDGRQSARPETPGRFEAGPEMVWIQVESQPDLATTLRRARFFSLTYDHAAAFATTSGWYAIVIGVADRDEAEQVLSNLRLAGGIPGDSLLTSGSTYLTRVWPPRSGGTPDGLDAAIAREASWDEASRRGVQNALVWTGDYNGVLDGEFGPRTRQAIRSFQQHNGFPVTGYLTAAEIDLLEYQRMAAVGDAGFEIVDDLETGLRIGFPTAIFERAGRDDGIVSYRSLPGQPEADLALLSFHGGPVDVRDLYRELTQPDAVAPDAYAVLEHDWFVISAEQDGTAFYAYLRADHGAVKGFLLEWPVQLTPVYRPISVAMFNSFESIPGIVLDPSSPDPGSASSETARLGPESEPGGPRRTGPDPWWAAAPLAPREGNESEPARRAEPETLATGTGIVVDRAGRILTNAHVVEGCAGVAIDDGIAATVAAIDGGLDLALIETPGRSWPSVARFAARPARLNSDVTVIGYPLHGLLGGVNVTRGSVSAATGLMNDATQFQMTAAVQPGNSGGPVLDADGALVGVVQSKLDAAEVAAAIGDIPQNVNFAIRGELAKLFLTGNGVAFAIAEPRPPVTPADLAEEARSYTVLVRCLDR